MGFIMPQTFEKLEGHSALGLCGCQFVSKVHALVLEFHTHTCIPHEKNS